MMSMPVPGITQMGGNPQYPNFGVQTGMPQSGMGQMPPWLMSMFQQMNPGGPGGPQSMPIPGMQMPGMGGPERDGGMGGMGRGRGGRMSGFQGPRPRPPWSQGGGMPYNDTPWGQAGGPPMPWNGGGGGLQWGQPPQGPGPAPNGMPQQGSGAPMDWLARDQAMGQQIYGGSGTQQEKDAQAAAYFGGGAGRFGSGGSPSGQPGMQFIGESNGGYQIGPGGMQSMPLPGMQAGPMGRHSGGKPWQGRGTPPPSIWNQPLFGMPSGPPPTATKTPIGGMQSMPSPMMQMPMPQYGRYGGG